MATAAQNPNAMAAKAVELGVSVMNGKAPDSPVVLLSPNLITKANAAGTEGWPNHL